MSDDFDTRLLDLIYGELTPDEAQAFEAELSQDAAAQQTAQDWRRVREAVKDLPVPEPDPQVHYNILRAAREAVEPAAKPKSLWAWLSGLALNPAFAGVAVLALAVGSLVFFQLDEDAPESALDQAANAPAVNAAAVTVGAEGASAADKSPREAEPRAFAEPGPSAQVALAEPNAPGEIGQAQVPPPTAADEVSKLRRDEVAADDDAEDTIKDARPAKDSVPAFGRGGGGRDVDKVALAINGEDAKAKPARDDDGDFRTRSRVKKKAREAPGKRRKSAKLGPADQKRPQTRTPRAPIARKDVPGRAARTRNRSAVAAPEPKKKTPAAKARRSRVAAKPAPRKVSAAKAKGTRFAPPPPATARGGDGVAHADAAAERVVLEEKAEKAETKRPDAKVAEDGFAPGVSRDIRGARSAVTSGAKGQDSRVKAESVAVTAIGRVGDGRDAEEAQGVDADAAPVQAAKSDDLLDAKADKGGVGEREARAPAAEGLDLDDASDDAPTIAKATVAPKVVVAPSRRAMAFDSGRASPMGDSLSAGGGAAPQAMPAPVAARANSATQADASPDETAAAGLRLNPGSAGPAAAPPTALSEARAARARGDHRTAVGAYARYFQSNPRDGQFARGLFEAAASHEALGQFEQAIRLYGLVPSNMGTLYARARARVGALRAARAATVSEAAPADAAGDVGEADRVEPKPLPPSVDPPR